MTIHNTCGRPITARLPEYQPVAACAAILPASTPRDAHAAAQTRPIHQPAQSHDPPLPGRRYPLTDCSDGRPTSSTTSCPPVMVLAARGKKILSPTSVRNPRGPLTQLDRHTVGKRGNGRTVHQVLALCNSAATDRRRLRRAPSAASPPAASRPCCRTITAQRPWPVSLAAASVSNRTPPLPDDVAGPRHGLTTREFVVHTA